MSEQKNPDARTFWMGLALEQARMAQVMGEVPVGAVLVLNGTLVASGFNRMISQSDPTGHAEMVVLREGAKRIGNYRLVDTQLYCTLEPCLMCYSAMVHARIAQLVYAAHDYKTGVFSTRVFDDIARVYNHPIDLMSGVMGEEASVLLSRFFQERRRREGLDGTPP